MQAAAATRPGAGLAPLRCPILAAIYFIAARYTTVSAITQGHPGLLCPAALAPPDVQGSLRQKSMRAEGKPLLTEMSSLEVDLDKPCREKRANPPLQSIEAKRQQARGAQRAKQNVVAALRRSNLHANGSTGKETGKRSPGQHTVTDHGFFRRLFPSSGNAWRGNSVGSGKHLSLIHISEPTRR